MTTYGGEPPVRSGVNAVLEAEADRLIFEPLKSVTSMEAKRDVLTPWKQKNRLEREVYPREGVPEASTLSGMYHRAWNPEQTHLNSRDGLARGTRIGASDFDEGGFEDAVAQHLGEAGF